MTAKKSQSCVVMIENKKAMEAITETRIVLSLIRTRFWDWTEKGKKGENPEEVRILRWRRLGSGFSKFCQQPSSLVEVPQGCTLSDCVVGYKA